MLSRFAPQLSRMHIRMNKKKKIFLNLFFICMVEVEVLLNWIRTYVLLKNTTTH